jgi:hypothetical protein
MQIGKSLICFTILICLFSGCIQKKNVKPQETQLAKPLVFEFKNDTITQIMEIFQLSSDTLKVNLNMTNTLRDNSCLISGLAIHDTIGDFLHEEETTEIENSEVISIKDFWFFDEKGSSLFVISVDRVSFERLVFYGKPDSLSRSTYPKCLFYSVGTLKKTL